MDNKAKKNILLLVVAGVVLAAANLAVYLGARSGQIAPVENMVIWGTFAGLSVCSILWAIGLLGLEPSAVAVSYALGGVMAYFGVRLTPDINVVEITTAGATCGAFGALLTGHATTKVRAAFFIRQQMPYVFIILVLLLVCGVLNSRMLQAGWHGISNAMVFPFLFGGVVVALFWSLLVKAVSQSTRREKQELRSESVQDAKPQMPAEAEAVEEELNELMFSVPEVVDAEVPAEQPDEVPDDEPAVLYVSSEEVTEDVPQNESDEDGSAAEGFFPLEIDESGEEPLQDNPDLIGLAAMVAQSAPESIMDTGPELAIDSSSEPIPPAPDPKEDFAEQPEEEPPETVRDYDFPEVEKTPDPEENKAKTEHLLNSHLDLLNKIRNKKQE